MTLKLRQTHLAFRDILLGFANWPIWMHMAKLELLQKYRGSVFGPLWNTFSFLILTLAMGYVFGALWGEKGETYMPYLASGMLCWYLLTDLINTGSAVFLTNSGIIKQSALPYSVYVLSVVVGKFALFIHHIVAFILIALYFQVQMNANTWMVIPGIALFLLNGLWVGLFLGSITCRYRDIQPLLQNILQVSFFVTPVFWAPDRLGPKRAFLVDFNPLYHFLSVLREPMLGNAPEMISWLVVISITVLGFTGMLFFFGRCRHRIAYWV